MTALRLLRFGACVACLTVASACSDRAALTDPLPEPVELPEPLAADEVRERGLGAWRKYYMAHTHYETTLAMSATADVLTGNCCWVRFDNMEPRIAYGNSAESGSRGIAATPWEGVYEALDDANAVLHSILNRGVEMSSVDEARTLEVLARVTKAAVHTHLALLFDQAFIIDEDSVRLLEADPTAELSLHPYSAVANAARRYWDDVISMTAGANWSLEGDAYEIMGLHGSSGTALSAEFINRLAHTMRARLVAYTPRTAAEASATDWNSVLNHARKGVTDISGSGTGVMLGFSDDWYSYFSFWLPVHDRFRVDHRIVVMMAPNVPPKFTGDSASLAEGVSTDARYGTDVVYRGDVVGDPLRGIYMQSTHYHARWENISYDAPPASRMGLPVPFILPAENNLLMAEAILRTSGNAAIAADLINLTRVGRGGLPPATAADGPSTLMDYLLYERYVELIGTSGTELLDARRFDDVQPGTWRHLPVPARVLEHLGLPVYTFGGIGNEM
jgi:hypothetical protein